MEVKLMVVALCAAQLMSMIDAGGGGDGGHKKVIIHVPFKIKHHHHTHTIVKHIHHKEKGGDDGDHYEVLGYTYGEPKHGGGGGHGWGASDEGHAGDESPVSFEGASHGSYAIAEEHSDYGIHEGH